MNLDRELLFRFFNQQTTLAEEEKIRLWVNECEQHRQEFLRTRKLFDALLLHGTQEIGQKEPAYVAITWRRAAMAVSSIAAVVLLAVFITQHLLYQSFDDSELNTIMVPTGQHIEMTLSDGTQVWLNAKTTMEYPQSFKWSKQRMVKIDGEAYFEVSRDEAKPFVVKTEKGDIEVLGTKFYVNAYAGTGVFETSLMEGKVNVHAAQQEMILYPNDKAVLQNNQLIREKIEDQDVYRWRDGLYCFKDEYLEDVFKQLEVYYDVQFVKENDRLDNPKLNGKFRLIDGVDYALRVLQKEVDFTFRRDDEKNVIYLK